MFLCRLFPHCFYVIAFAFSDPVIYTLLLVFLSFIIIIIILFAQIMSKQIHWRQYNGTVCEQDIPGSYEH